MKTANKNDLKQVWRSTFPVEGEEFTASDGTGVRVVRATRGAAVSTVSYVRVNDPSGRVIHCNMTHF